MQPVFWFDFGSPNAYLAYRVLPGIEAETGLRFRMVPVLLGGLFKLTGNRAPMVAHADVPAKLAYERREMARFIERHDLRAFTMNPFFPVNTLMLMRGAVAAQAAGVFEAYMAAGFRFMWEEPRKMDDAAVLTASLSEAGLPAERLLALSGEAAVKERLAANTQDAFAHGAFGIPSFLVGEELFFGKDRLADVRDELVRQRQAGQCRR